MNIYLDNAATTPIFPEVVAKMNQFLHQDYGNPSSIHGAGREARRAVESAREQVARLVDCHPAQLVFTSSGTESIHHALLGAFLANPERRHIVTTAIEHHAVLQTCELLEHLGAEISYVRPRADCIVRCEDVLAELRPDTLLVSVMGVNNETGSIQPVVDLAARVKAQDSDVLVHSDFVQALPVFPVHLRALQIDYASFSAHKIHGPKGVGALYLANQKRWLPVLRGGNQERQRRGGTENVPGIVGFGAAAELLMDGFQNQYEHLRHVADAFWDMLSKIPGAYRNSPLDAAPTILNVGFRGVANDVLLMRLDLAGISASAGSACTAGSLQPSHVLEACDVDRHVLKEAVRFSFSSMTSEDEVVKAAEIIRDIVFSLRG